jgi:hypothetical protein
LLRLQELGVTILQDLARQRKSLYTSALVNASPISLCFSSLLQELGVTILQDLARQRETITHARDTLHGADDNISKARKVRL